MWQESAMKQYQNDRKNKMRANQLEDPQIQTVPQVRTKLVQINLLFYSFLKNYKLSFTAWHIGNWLFKLMEYGRSNLHFCNTYTSGFRDPRALFSFPIHKYFKLTGYSLIYVAHHILPPINSSITSHMPVQNGEDQSLMWSCVPWCSSALLWAIIQSRYALVRKPLSHFILALIIPRMNHIKNHTRAK